MWLLLLKQFPSHWIDKNDRIMDEFFYRQCVCVSGRGWGGGVAYTTLHTHSHFQEMFTNSTSGTYEVRSWRASIQPVTLQQPRPSSQLWEMKPHLMCIQWYLTASKLLWYAPLRVFVLGYLIRIQYKQVTMKTKQTCFVPEDKWPVV